MKIKRISNVLLLVLAMIMSVWGTYATKVDADGSGTLNPWVYTWKNLEKYKNPIEGQTYVEAGLHVYTVRELEVENYVPTLNQNFTVVTNTLNHLPLIMLLIRYGKGFLKILHMK